MIDLTDTDLTQLADTLAAALPLPAGDVVVTGPSGVLACMTCPPGTDRAAVAVLAWRPACPGGPLLREPCCARCLPAEVYGLAALHPTIEIPAVITP